MTGPNLAPPTDEIGLFTDLYELTMAQAYYRHEMFAPATFSLFVRSYPPNRAYFVSAGLADVLEYLSLLNFGDRAVAYLRSTSIFGEDFLEFLKGVRFTGSVRAHSGRAALLCRRADSGSNRPHHRSPTGGDLRH